MKKNIKKLDKKSLNKIVKVTWSPKKDDPNGSYTGAAPAGEKPVQDADDL